MLGKRLIEANNIAKKRIKAIPNLKLWFDVSKDKDRILGIVRKTRVFCSNPLCCGNPRRIKGRKMLTRQELIIEQKEREQKEDAIWLLSKKLRYVS